MNEAAFVHLPSGEVWRSTEHYRLARYPGGDVKMQQLWISNQLATRWEEMRVVNVDEAGVEIKA